MDLVGLDWVKGMVVGRSLGVCRVRVEGGEVWVGLERARSWVWVRVGRGMRVRRGVVPLLRLKLLVLRCH